MFYYLANNTFSYTRLSGNQTGELKKLRGAAKKREHSAVHGSTRWDFHLLTSEPSQSILVPRCTGNKNRKSTADK